MKSLNIFYSAGSIFIILAFYIPQILNAQDKPFNCSSIKSGTFYLYPNNTTESYKIIRNENSEIDYMLKSGDSIAFKIKWTGKCAYSLEYQSNNCGCGTELDVLKKHKLAREIVSLTGDYYTVKTYLDRIDDSKGEDRQLSTDTIWLKALEKVTNQEIFKPLTDSGPKIEKNFRDTSRYAILYTYRPNRFMAMLNEYYVYCDNNFLFWAQNKAKAVFKIVRDGPITFYAKSGGEESRVTLNVQFGKKYFLECFIHHKISHATPELKMIESKQGESEF